MAAEVLVVDDDEDIRFSIGEILRHEGYQVAELSSGESLLEYLEQHTPRVVLLDLSLPGTNTEELAIRLREGGWLEKTTILAMSGLEDADECARRMGLHGTVNKPFDLTMLLSRVSEVVGR